MFHRACIQLNLPEDVAIQVDCLVYAAQSADASVREAMHVQSISHWAPANIGPYSQATKVLYSRSCLFRTTQYLVISIAPVASLHTSQVAHQAEAYPGFLSIKRLGVFLLPLDGMLVHRRVAPPSIKFADTQLYTLVERGTVRVKCLAQEHNTMSPLRA